MVHWLLKSSLILYLVQTSFSATTSNEVCASCFWDYTGDEYYACINEFCQSAFLSPLSLFSSGSSVSSLCLSCSDLDSDEYSSCIQQNCESEILSKALKVSALHPNTLLSFEPTEDKVSFLCSMTESGPACTKLQWESEISLDSLAASNSRCKECSVYKGQNYRNCATFHCNNEVKTHLLADFPQITPIDLSECTDKCYEKYLKTKSDYSNCVRINCNKSKIGLTKQSTEASQCDSCMDLADSRYMSKCLQAYCKSEIISQLLQNSQLNFGCVDCSGYYESGQYDQYAQCLERFCKSDLVHAGYEYFSQESSLSQCGQCTNYESGSEYETACVLIYCESDFLDKSSYLTKENSEFTQNQCLNQCMNSRGMSEVCYLPECKESIQNLFSLYIDNFNRQEKLKDSDCSSCLFSGNSEKCSMQSCKSQIISKQNLFGSERSSAFSKQCSACLNFEGFQYFSCVSNNCKQEVADSLLLTASKSPEKLLNKRPVYFKSCSQCAQYYSEAESEFQYLCIVQNCKSEFVNSASLITGESIGSCSQCKGFSGSEFENCAVFYCKAEILGKFESFKSENSLESVVKFSECTDSCYYDWYYYGYDYYTCAYEYCKHAGNSNVPKHLVAKLGLKEYKSQCEGSYEEFCVVNLCKAQELVGISQGSENSKCNQCSVAMDEGILNEKGFKACVALSCLSELSAVGDSEENYKIFNKITEEYSGNQEGSEEYCKQLANGQVKGDYRSCYHLFSSLNEAYQTGYSLNILIISLVLLSIIIGLLSRYQKSFKTSSPDPVHAHPYHLL